MSLSKKDMELIASLIDGKLSKAEVPTTTTKQQEKKTPAKKGVKHKKSEIPSLISKMTKQESVEIFGDMTVNPKETPYLCSLENFFETYNIQLETRVRNGKEITDKPFLSRQLRHSIIMKQLDGETKKTFDTVKKNCIEFLQEKISKIPENATIPQQKQKEYNLAEIQRWNNETFKTKK